MDPDKVEQLREFYDNTGTAEMMEDAETVDLSSRTSSDAMSAFTVRLPTAVLNAARDIAGKRQLTTGAVLRELIEAGIAQTATDDIVVPVSELRWLISTAEACERPNT